jgi:hypothetical protein
MSGVVLVNVIGAVLAAAAAEQEAFVAAEREAERLARLTPFVLPAGVELPPALKNTFNDFSDAGMFAHAAGLCLRFSFSRAGDPDGTAVQAWWTAQTPEARKRVEELALIEAIHILDNVDAFEGEVLDRGVAEGLALSFDSLFCLTTTLWQMRTGWPARQAEANLHTRLGSLLAAQPPGKEWESPLLDAWARRGGGWWTVAPGASAPPFDEDAFDLDEEAESWLAEDWLAMNDEEAHQ